MKTPPDWHCETLPEGAVLTRRDVRDMGVLCVAGRLWVTEAGFVEDHILRPGGSCVVRGPGLVVIEALRDAVLVCTAPDRRFRPALFPLKKSPAGPRGG